MHLGQMHLGQMDLGQMATLYAVSSVMQKIQFPAAPHKRLVEDCTRMRDKSAFSDVTLKVGERSSFPCSKFILAARSEVFRAMFELPMRESIENEVRIEDAEPSAVEDMLEYVYTDGIIHLSLTVSPNEGIFCGMKLQKCANFSVWLNSLPFTFKRGL